MMNVKRHILLTICFITIAQLAISQTSNVVGKYISKKKFNDVWMLQLKQDSTYTFDSEIGESIFPGSWIHENKMIVLVYVSEDKKETINFRIRPNNKWQLKGKPFQMARFKLRKV